MTCEKHTVLIIGSVMFTVFVAKVHATTIVIIRTPQHVVAGADSLITHWSVGGTISKSQACKLHRQNATFFAIEGMGIAHPGTGFSAEQLARRAVMGSKSIRDATLYFARMATTPYARVMTRMRKESPSSWALIQQHRGTGIALVAVFFGIEKWVSTYGVVGIRVSTGKQIIAVADTALCPGSACEGYGSGTYGMIIGQSDAAYQRIGGVDQVSFAKFQHELSDISTVKAVIEIEKESVPDSVGGPIDIVTVDSAGAHWSDSVGSCAPEH